MRSQNGGRVAAETELVGLIYEAALKPKLWQGVLQRLCNLAGCTQAMLVAHHPAEADITFFYCHGISQEYQRSFASRFALVSPNAMKCFFNDLGVAQCSELFDDLSAFQNSLYFQQWCAPQQVARQCILMLVRDSHKCGALIVSLDEEDGATANGVLATLNSFSDHLIRAIRIHNTLVEQAKAAGAAKGTLDRIDAPVLMLDESCHIIARNSKAMANPSLMEGQSAEQALGKIYGAAKVAPFVAAIAQGPGKSLWDEFYVTPPGQISAPHILTHMQLPHDRDVPEGFVFGPNPTSIVIIHDTGAEKTVRPESFIRLFNLTPSEAHVLALLARGFKPKDIALHQGVALSTVRSQVAAVMEKTGTRRQADLVRVAVNSMLPAAFARA